MESGQDEDMKLHKVSEHCLPQAGLQSVSQTPEPVPPRSLSPPGETFWALKAGTSLKNTESESQAAGMQSQS